MSVTQNTLIGKTRGSTGGVTFTSWKGINVIKSKAVSVADPRTQPQLDQRQKMANFVELFRLNAALFNAGFKQQAVRQSAYNAAASTNLKNGSLSISDAQLIEDISLLEVAKGSLYKTELLDFSLSAGSNSAIIDFSTSVVADQLTGDKVYATVYDSTGVVMGVSLGVNSRSSGSLSISGMSDVVLGVGYTCFLFFVQSSTGKVSDSALLSAIAGA